MKIGNTNSAVNSEPFVKDVPAMNPQKETTCELCDVHSNCAKHTEDEPEEWIKEFNSAFNWAKQIKDAELERWKVMYGFTPNDIKAFIQKTREEARVEGFYEGEKNEFHNQSGYMRGRWWRPRSVWSASSSRSWRWVTRPSGTRTSCS